MKHAVIQRLQEIELANGGILRPSDVVEDAKSPDSPLHDLFDWDVNRAAERHWIDRARQIITSVKVVVSHNKTAVSTVYYVRDPSIESGKQGYVSISSLSEDQSRAKEAVIREFAVAMAALKRAQAVAKSLNIEPSLASVMVRLQDVQAIVAGKAVRG